MDDIAGLFKDELAVSAVRFHRRFMSLGMPYRDWADCPNRLVQVIELLDPLDKLYHPRSVL